MKSKYLFWYLFLARSVIHMKICSWKLFKEKSGVDLSYFNKRMLLSSSKNRKWVKGGRGSWSKSHIFFVSTYFENWIIEGDVRFLQNWKSLILCQVKMSRIWGLDTVVRLFLWKSIETLLKWMKFWFILDLGHLNNSNFLEFWGFGAKNPEISQKIKITKICF